MFIVLYPYRPSVKAGRIEARKIVAITEFTLAFLIFFCYGFIVPIFVEGFL